MKSSQGVVKECVGGVAVSDAEQENFVRWERMNRSNCGGTGDDGRVRSKERDNRPKRMRADGQEGRWKESSRLWAGSEERERKEGSCRIGRRV